MIRLVHLLTKGNPHGQKIRLLLFLEKHTHKSHEYCDRYDPATDTWTPINVNGAPPARRNPTSVWTGTQLIVWGGRVTGIDQNTNTGGIYESIGSARRKLESLRRIASKFNCKFNC